MANPLGNEEELYEKIKREHITVDPIIWGLLKHHLNNDLGMISLGLGEYAALPKWILKTASWVIRVLYKISRLPGPPPRDLTDLTKDGLERVCMAAEYMRKIYWMTYVPKKEG